MRIYVALISLFVFSVGVSSCSSTRHTTCAAYGASIQKIDKNQDEIHANVIEDSSSEKM